MNYPVYQSNSTLHLNEGVIDREMIAYQHEGFWLQMDNIHDREYLKNYGTAVMLLGRYGNNMDLTISMKKSSCNRAHRI